MLSKVKNKPRVPIDTPLRYIIEIISIVIGTALLLFLIFKGTEIPKFVYNHYERQINAPIENLLDKSQNIIDLIEEKRQTAAGALDNPDSTVTTQDLNSYTIQVMTLFDNGKNDFDDIQRMLTIQSRIPFLPASYRQYHTSKIQWFTIHKQWFDTLLTIKTAEKQVSDQSNQMQNAGDLMREIGNVDVVQGLSYASAAASLINGVLSGIDRMEKNGMMTSDMKQYYVNFANTISIVQELHGKIINDPSYNWDKYAKDFDKRNASIPVDRDYLTIYTNWRHSIIDPLDDKKLKYYDESLDNFDETISLRESANIPDDDISTWMKKRGLL